MQNSAGQRERADHPVNKSSERANAIRAQHRTKQCSIKLIISPALREHDTCISIQTTTGRNNERSPAHLLQQPIGFQKSNSITNTVYTSSNHTRTMFRELLSYLLMTWKCNEPNHGKYVGLMKLNENIWKSSLYSRDRKMQNILFSII